MTRITLKVVLLFGGSMNIYNLSRLRMLGDEILVVSDGLPMRLLFNEHIATFRSNSNFWSGNSILNPRNIYYFIISRTIKDQEFWSRVLESEFIHPETLKPKIKGDFMVIRNNRGALQNENEMMDSNLMWNLIDENLKLKEEEEERERQLKRGDKGKRATDESCFADDKMKSEGLDEEQIKRHKKFDAPRQVGATIEDLIDLLNNPEIKEGVSLKKNELSETMKKIVRRPKAAIQHEMIMQAPMVFGGGRSKGRPVKNSIFRERKIIAEAESLCPGLIWKILSGSLYISQETRDYLVDQITAFKMMISHAREHKKGKQFVLNLCMLILNDAIVVANPDDDLLTWRQLSSAMLKLMLLDEDKPEKSEWTFQEESEDLGVLKYGFSGESYQP